MLSSMASFASRAVAEPNTTSEYERALVPLESEHGQVLAASLPDFALPRLCAATEYFEAQIEASWCCIAAFRMALRALASLARSTLSRARLSLALTRRARSRDAVAQRWLRAAARVVAGYSSAVRRWLEAQIDDDPSASMQRVGLSIAFRW